MPVASRAEAMVAGILGGSGSHVVQIIIAIVVAVAERSFDVAQDEVVRFQCHGPRFWPMLVCGTYQERTLDIAQTGVTWLGADGRAR